MVTGKKRPRRNNQGPKVFAKKVKAKEDLARALKMREAGLSVRAIGAHLGRSIGWVSEEVNRAVEELPLENAKVYRAHMVAREEAIIAAHWTKRHLSESAKVIQGSDKLLMDLLGLASAMRAEITIARELNEGIDRLEAGLPPDVYQQVIALLAGEPSPPASVDTPSEGP